MTNSAQNQQFNHDAGIFRGKQNEIRLIDNFQFSQYNSLSDFILRICYIIFKMKPMSEWQSKRWKNWTGALTSWKQFKHIAQYLTWQPAR